MSLICLSCASADCTCGRLVWVVDFLNRIRRRKETISAAASSAQGKDPAELGLPFVLTPRDG